ncbi:MAG: hypothetical protein RLZZ156_1767 [Deinococcota bacterium]|jgi:hypothetical protein
MGMVWSRAQQIGVPLGLIVVLVGMVHWGGTATPGPVFVLGVAVLIGLIVGFAGFLYWLLFSPIQNAVVVKPNPVLRQLGAIAVLTSATLMTFATAWDESWHRRFGVGNDFLWMPHILMYSSFAICSLLASAGMVYLVLRGQGGLRSRARAEPLVALLACVSLFLLFSAPSDLLWHRIYGLDITAWSLPHITLLLGFIGLMLCGITLALSHTKTTIWQGLRGIGLNEWLTIWLCGTALMFMLQFGTTEWDNITKERFENRVSKISIFWERPEWLYVAALLGVTGFIGAFVQNATKRVGVATLVGLFLIVQRAIALSLIGGFDLGMSLRSHLLALMVLMAIDLIAYWRKNAIWTWIYALSSGGLALTFLMLGMSQILIYPRVNLDTILGHVLAGGLSWCGFSYVGALLGRNVSSMEKLEAVQVVWLPRLTVAALTSVMTLLMVAIFTAVPPAL